MHTIHHTPHGIISNRPSSPWFCSCGLRVASQVTFDPTPNKYTFTLVQNVNVIYESVMYPSHCCCMSSKSTAVSVATTTTTTPATKSAQRRTERAPYSQRARQTAIVRRQTATFTQWALDIMIITLQCVRVCVFCVVCRQHKSYPSNRLSARARLCLPSPPRGHLPFALTRLESNSQRSNRMGSRVCQIDGRVKTPATPAKRVYRSIRSKLLRVSAFIVIIAANRM